MAGVKHEGVSIMKYFDIHAIDTLPGARIGPTDTFCFHCHPEIACFNRCCRNLNLFLYPYDVIRLTKALGISSDEFLDDYVDIVLRPYNFFPEVLLRMSADPEKTCPFLADSGCSVYSNRPDTCRSFPIEQGIWHDAIRNQDFSIYFFRPPDFCLGQHEKKEWTISAWTQDQEALVYHHMTIRWAELKRRFQDDPWGPEGLEGPKAKMAFMATYNVDRFREFVFSSSLMKRYQIKSTLRDRLRSDNLQLLVFGFEWVKFYLWGIQSPMLRLR
jgi:Fe-S-cluster containining protein